MTKITLRLRKALARAQALTLSPLRLFWFGVLGAVAGALAETLFMYLTRGELCNRSSLLYGQFSLVWGGGAVIFTLLLRRPARHGVWAVFLAGAFWGTVFELACSWLLEGCFGVTFWDYSHLPLSIGGRINLVFSFFWGTAATVWTLWLLPWLDGLLERVPRRVLLPATAILAVLLLLDVLFTALALFRYSARQEGQAARNGLELLLDRRWGDQRLFQRFPYMRHLEEYRHEHPNFW